MKYFMKLNVVSMLYALLVVVPIELMLNLYRIARVTSWGIETVNILSTIVILLDIILGTMLLFYLSNKWLGGRKANFWSVLLWIPYLILFVVAIAYFFPITYRGDTPNPVSGILIIGGLIIYPLYMLTVNFLSTTTDH